jgi:hypothetical protein
MPTRSSQRTASSRFAPSSSTTSTFSGFWMTTDPETARDDGGTDDMVQLPAKPNDILAPLKQPR